MTSDDDPDLVVSYSYEEQIGNDYFTRGIVACFEARRTGGVLQYTLINYYDDLDYAATGITVADYSTDGRPDVLVTSGFIDPYNPGPDTDQSKVFVFKNIAQASPSTDYGFIDYLGYMEPSPLGTNPTHGVVSGQFSNIVSGGLGGGGTGNTLDFITFGGGNSGILFGAGTGVGEFTFNINTVLGDTCGTTSYGFGYGSVVGEPAPLVSYDPIANRNRSIATLTGLNTVSLLHVNPLSGSFFHYCDGNDSLDTYDMTRDTSMTCSGTPPLVSETYAYLAKGKLNADAFEDLVWVNGGSKNLAFLLGRGTVGSDGKIMEYSECDSDGFFIGDYAPSSSSSGVHFDQVICADLNMDGYDEIIISRRGGEYSDSPYYRIVVLSNTTASCP